MNRLKLLTFALLAAAIAACDGSSPTGGGDASLTASWAAKNTGNALWGDSIRLSITQADTVLTGTYTAVGTSGRGGSYTDVASGTVKGSAVKLGLTYDPRSHGCTGSESACFKLYLSFTGTTQGTRIDGTFSDGLNQWPASFHRG